MGYEVHLEVFDGPFDLLLQLISAQEVDVYEVRLSDIVDAFCAEIARHEQFDLEIATEFLLMATLVELKCRRLLPGLDDPDLDEELSLFEARDYLLARLVECKTFTGAAQSLAQMEQAAAHSVARVSGPDESFEGLAPDLLAGVLPERLRQIAWHVLRERPLPTVAVHHIHEDIDVQSEEMLVNMGPQHPSTHGVLRIVLRTDGEMVLEAVPHLGYLHRCKEKIGENLPYYQYIGYTDRLDYLSAMNNNHAWSMAVEKLANIEVPLRAEYIRVLASELNRIASHLVSFGAYGLDMGAFTPFLYAFREREYILDLFEQLCGARLTLSYINIGGVTWDLPPLFLEKLTEFLDYFEPKIDEYNDLLSFNHIFIKRTANVGIVSKELAIKYALTGPMIRGSGIPLDLRRDQPYSIYDRLEFDVCVGTGLKGTLGDCWDRYWVKMLEMKQSIRILRQCIAQMPDGLSRAKLPRAMKVPLSEVYAQYENPRGQLGFFIESQGGPIPYRVHIRGPSFINLAVTHELCSNVLLADVPAIIGSIDIVMGEVDR